MAQSTPVNMERHSVACPVTLVEKARISGSRGWRGSAMWEGKSKSREGTTPTTLLETAQRLTAQGSHCRDLWPVCAPDCQRFYYSEVQAI